MKDHFHLKIFYEDTDLAGIVYYANYLKFIERARSEMLSNLNISQKELFEDGKFFVVTDLKAKYLLPAFFCDNLEVVTELQEVKGASLLLSQKVFRSTELLFKASINLALLKKNGKVTRLPANIRQLLET
ncbi:MAG: thioesterase [Rhodobacteraceae bacterium]|nr:thioesterase [Paracoccaceae bacterium]RZO39371.1 MAG: YbgC/FadM family acyl-CoA thioesterase [Paracoccaceae bacterium]